MSKRYYSSAAVLAAILGAVVAIGLSYFMKIEKLPNNRPVILWLDSAPTTPDPLEYDSFAHHVVFRSVLSGLVSQYRLGEFTGTIAEKWTVSSDQKTWIFSIRPGLYFEDGTPITATSVIRAWSRLAFLLQRRKSHSELFDKLEGMVPLHSASDSIPGLRAVGNSLIIKLNAPFPKLLETISFGLYSVVHPNDFESASGEWKNPERVIASGPYRVQNWEEEGIRLHARDGYLGHLWHPNIVRNYLITWDGRLRLSADLIVGSSAERGLAASHTFFGSPPSNIAYVYCLTWKNPDSPCFSLNSRKAMRAAFYEVMKKFGLQPTTSFFPVGMQGISEVDSTRFNGSEEISAGNKTLSYRISSSLNPFVALFVKSVPEWGGALGIKVHAADVALDTYLKVVDSGYVSRDIDILAMFTGVLLEDPVADIRFMFLSKEGIRLPDADGRIYTELKKENINPQKINEILWEQALIWPMGHFALGMWAKEDLDLSWLNPLLPPVELQWIGYK